MVDKNEDWLTGQVVGSGVDPSYPLRHGIFPSNFVTKFPFPLDYIGKYAIGLATEVYLSQENNQLTLNPMDSQLVAIKKVAPDAKWSFGESYVSFTFVKTNKKVKLPSIFFSFSF